MKTARDASDCVGMQPIMVATAMTEHSYWLRLRLDGNRAVVAFVRLCDSMILFVSPHHKTKMAETKDTKLGTGTAHHDSSPTNEY